MITKRRINIPIFNYRLLIIIYDKWEEVKDMHRGNVEPKAFTRIFPDGYSMVVINSKEEASIIHEAEHVKNAIWEFIGYSPQVDNDEVDAYLLTYIYIKILENEHYHNCSELFKSWFGEDIDQKVIEAAILFWFKDDDCKSNSKLWNHFKEN